jgi:hypothetical protein
MRGLILVLLAVLGVGCGEPARAPSAAGWAPVHDDLGFALGATSRVRDREPVDRYESREIVEPIEGGTLRVQLTIKVLDERERKLIAARPDAIGEIWPNALELRRSELVSGLADRAWQAIDYDPSGLAHEDFAGGHSTYRTPASVSLHVAFVYKGTLVVMHASAEIGEPPKDSSEQALIETWTPALESVIARLRRTDQP